MFDLLKPYSATKVRWINLASETAFRSLVWCRYLSIPTRIAQLSIFQNDSTYMINIFQAIGHRGKRKRQHQGPLPRFRRASKSIPVVTGTDAARVLSVVRFSSV